MTVALLSELREPPVVGRFYMVPAVTHEWCGINRAWPVLGALHSDADFFEFTDVHYHVDARFVPASVAKRLENYFYRIRTIEEMCQATPLAKLRGEHMPELPRGRPALAKFRCRTADFPYGFGHTKQVGYLRAAYGDRDPGPMFAREVPNAICRRDGRKLCPHRKVDLSQFIADAEGVVTCPLHGLRVRVGAPAHA